MLVLCFYFFISFANTDSALPSLTRPCGGMLLMLLLLELPLRFLQCNQSPFENGAITCSANPVINFTYGPLRGQNAETNLCVILLWLCILFKGSADFCTSAGQFQFQGLNIILSCILSLFKVACLQQIMRCIKRKLHFYYSFFFCSKHAFSIYYIEKEQKQ